MSYDEKVDARLPFSTIKADGEINLLILPVNISEVLAHSVMGPLAFFIIEHWGKNVTTSDQKLELSVKSEQERLFFLGLINRLTNPFPETGYKFSTDKKAPQKKGRACADAELYLGHGNVKYARFEYLPPSVKIGKSKLLSSMVYDMIGMKQRGIAEGILTCIARIAKEKNIKDSNAMEAFNSFLIPIGVIVETIVRKKVIEVRKNGQMIKQSTPIHVGRPSSFLEVLTDIEKEYLKAKEAPWDDIHTITTSYAKGIKIVEIAHFINIYKDAYDRTFDVANKLNSWRAIRRRKFEEYLPKGKKTRSFKTTDIEGFLSWLVETEEEGKFVFNTQNIDLMNFGGLKSCFEEAFLFNQFTKGSSLNTPGIVNKVRRELPREEFASFIAYIGWIPLGRFSEYIGYLTGQQVADPRMEPYDPGD